MARRIHHDAVRDVVVRQFGHWDDQAQDAFFDRDWAGADFEMIECDGQVCGYVAIEHRPDDVHVRELDLDPRFQRRGIGTAVLQSAINAAAERGVPVLIATLHKNEAVALYQRLGFVEFERDATHVSLRKEPPGG